MKPTNTRIGLAALLCLAGQAPADPRSEPSFRIIPRPGATAISADGLTVIGTSAWMWTAAGGFVDLYEPISISMTPKAVSADGSVIVGNAVINGTDRLAFRWTAETGPVPIGDLPGGLLHSWCDGVSHAGDVIAGASKSEASGQMPEACRWSEAEGMEALGTWESGAEYSESLAVSGDGATLGGRLTGTWIDDAFVWTRETGVRTFQSLTGARVPGGKVTAISYSGDVLVGAGGHSLGREAFRWSSTDGMQWLGALAPIALSSESTAVSADGTVVVGTCHVHGTPAQRAFLWTSQAGMRDIKDVLEQDAGLDLTGWNLTIATGISSNGRVIVGNGVTPAGNQASWIARLGAPGCDGDVNGDGATNAADFVVLAANFGAGPGASRSQGDLSGEGVVSSADFTILVADFECDQN
jgi:uncharacterized membrane protein